MSRRFRTAELFALAALAGLAAFSWYRAQLVDASYGRYTGCIDCLEPSVWGNDGLLVAAFVALLAVSRLTRNRIARAALAALAAAIVLAYCMDIVVFRLLAHRLLVTDVLRYAGDAGILTTVVRPLLAQPEGWLIVAGAGLTLAAAAAAIAVGPASIAAAALWGLCSAVALMVASHVEQVKYIHSVALQNVVQVNLEVDPSRGYSKEAWQRALAAPAFPLHCEAGLGQGVSVIVLVVESLSSYHSRLFSGLNDYTPNLDRLARGATYFHRFHANGFSTEGGLIALLTGRVPIPTAGRNGSTMAFTAVDGDFHRWLTGNGYRTAFFTTGKLTFGERDRWLRAIGIEHAEGAEHPFYAGMARGAFDAASDAALFDRFLQWHEHEGRAAPFMATLLTVDTHPPFISGAGHANEGERFAETDRQIGRLAAALEARDFFAQGMMVIVGDHRAMTPIAEEEEEQFGASAAMRVPAVILGRSFTPPGEWSANAQQVDLIPSLRHVIGRRACRSDWQGRFLGEDPRAPRYVLLPDPIRRNQLSAIEGASQFTLLLDGDRTRWLEAPPRAADAERLLNRVNLERMARMPELRSAD
jgi:sulfatase-like protein